ncbi:MAG: hypothetical protein IKW59_01225 [Clostridia bacterium]|nr:hypothetical protein [Clostridia bacterium]
MAVFKCKICGGMQNDKYISSLREKKVGIIVQNDFKNFLESNILSEYIIEKLQ